MTAANTRSPIGSGSWPRRVSSRWAIIWAMTNAINTARPKPVSWRGPTSYESGSCTTEAKIFCIAMNLGCDQSRDRAARVGVEIESGSLTFLEAEEAGARDHRGVVGGKTGSWRENSNTVRLEFRSHRGSDRRIAGYPSAKHHPPPGN